MNRRDLLKFAGGAAVGALFTPAPWRLITDTALWSENWPGIPKPRRGEIATRFTHCPLCPAGCALQARCVQSQPVSLSGVEGGLCPFGVTAHHLPFHPARAKATAGPDEAAAAVAAGIRKAGSGERVAVLDPRPGRTASWTYRRAMAALPNGLYIAPPSPAVAVNLANARTVLSLGAPLLDGWCAPARAFAQREHFRLIQADVVESRTAALADEWLQDRPGSEDATNARIGQLTHDAGPVLAIDPEMSPNVVALNVALGGWGKTVFPRSGAPIPAAWRSAAPVTPLASVPDGSIRVLVIDESIPGDLPAWTEIERKLAPDPVVVAFAFTGEGHGRMVLRAPVFPETTTDLPAAIDSPAPQFRISTALTQPPAGAVDPVAFVAKAAGIDASSALRERADAIHGGGRGVLIRYADRSSTPIKSISADDFWKALNEGGRWEGEVANAPAPKLDYHPFRATSVAELTAVPTERVVAGSPLLSKIYRESNLLLGPGRIAMNPADAEARGIPRGGPALLEAAAASERVEVLLDPSVPAGIVLTAGAAAGPAKVVRL